MAKNGALNKAIKKAGSKNRLAAVLGVSRQAIQGWATNGIPAERVLAIEEATGIHRHELRPDIYPAGV